MLIRKIKVGKEFLPDAYNGLPYPECLTKTLLPIAIYNDKMKTTNSKRILGDRSKGITTGTA